MTSTSTVGTGRRCEEVGCERPYFCKGVCQYHYDRRRPKGRNGKKYGPCVVAGCPRVACFKGMCMRHYHESPLAVGECEAEGCGRPALPHGRCNRHTILLSRYKLHAAEYDQRYAEQGGCCAICREPGDLLCVDHDHTTGDVRGLLCHECNVGIGKLGDNAERLRVAADYLEHHQPRQSRTWLVRTSRPPNRRSGSAPARSGSAQNPLENSWPSWPARQPPSPTPPP